MRFWYGMTLVYSLLKAKMLAAHPLLFQKEFCQLKQQLFDKHIKDHKLACLKAPGVPMVDDDRFRLQTNQPKLLAPIPIELCHKSCGVKRRNRCLKGQTAEGGHQLGKWHSTKNLAAKLKRHDNSKPAQRNPNICPNWVILIACCVFWIKRK